MTHYTKTFLHRNILNIYLLEGKCSEKKFVEVSETNISHPILVILIFRDVTKFNP